MKISLIHLLHPRPPSSARQQRQVPGGDYEQVVVLEHTRRQRHQEGEPDLGIPQTEYRDVQPGLQRAGIQDLCLPHPGICLHRLGPPHCT